MKNRITLYSSTFLWLKEDRGLLYNSVSSHSDEFTITEDVKKVCEVFLNYDNLYSVEIETDGISESLQSFIDLVSNNGYGELTEKDTNRISLPPLLNIQSDELKLSSLSDITVYLGGRCDKTDYYRQIIFPYCSKDTLDSERLSLFLHHVGCEYLKRINIVISDTAEMDFLSRVIESLSSIKEKVFLCAVLSDSTKEEICHLKRSSGMQMEYICLPNAVSNDTLEEYSSSGHLNLIVRSTEECKQWEILTPNIDDEKYDYVPVYDNNIDFIEENVFLTKEEIKALHPTKREIFAHQAVNTELFGDLTILSDGNVYSDVNSPKIGTIEDSIYDILKKEKDSKKGWLHIRESEPCSRCLYQWICPSPSHYETVTGKTLCACHSERTDLP